MDAPFIFGKLAIQSEFTNRENELTQLANNFKSGNNTIIISPRRWGKSSLVAKAAQQVARTNKKIVFCHIDLFNIKSQGEFYQLLSQEVIRATATKWDERMEAVKYFLSRFIPKVTYSPDPNSDFAIGLDWIEVKKNPDQVIDLAEKIAVKKKIRIVLCIDEFQSINSFEDDLAFQKKLRSHWQRHPNVTYCLFGSKRHMMLDVFTSPSMPFYKFGDIMFLEKIEIHHWIKFITKRFSDTGKKISEEDAGLIATSVECHPYYVQQLAQLSWLRTSKNCSGEIIEVALEGLMLQLSLLFQNLTDSLTNTQINFMQALIDGSEKLSSKEMLYRYKLGTSANVLRINQALINKEILDSYRGKLVFLDPIYKLWLKNIYFLKSFL
jgi:AAA+ ATPase superfamily predicted ATPase